MPFSAQDLYFIAAFITAAVGTYMAESIRKKNAADTAKALTDTAMNIVNQKDEDIKELRQQNSILRLYIQYLLTGIGQLRSQLGQIIPTFTPKSLDEFQK
jgi:hypothetical protein